MLGVKNGYPVVPWALVLTSGTIHRKIFCYLKLVAYRYFVPLHSASWLLNPNHPVPHAVPQPIKVLYTHSI